MLFGILQTLSKNTSITTVKRSMAVFTQVLNPITGINQWDTRNDDYDYHQEVANAGFGDMIHDRERNQKYYAALKKTIAKMHAEGRKAHVLDIGTGTGILSMMAVSAGADSVTACEAFLPMANCAEKILKANGMNDKVQLIKKRSTDLIVGNDIPRRANLLVTEVLDTELIGEGAIGIYNHAHEQLLTDDVICIPSRASCWAQVVESPLAAQWNSMKIIANLDGDVLVKPPQAVKECKGSAVALHDMQLSQLPLESFRPLTDPIEIFQFDFNGKPARELVRSHNLKVKSNKAGSTDLVFYWWDIKMDLEGDILLSCAPYWAHPDFTELSRKKASHLPLPNVIPWRDHWMQAIYYIPRPLNLHAAQTHFVLSCNHDEYSLWFDAHISGNEDMKQKYLRHSCSCNLHTTYARSRIGQMNQTLRNKRFMRYLEDNLDKDSHLLVLGDGCVLGLAAAKLGAASVICYEPQSFSRRFMHSVLEENNLKNAELIERLEDLPTSALDKLTHIFAEPYFLTSILPWDNFYFGALLQKIKNKLPATVRIAPRSARILAVPVEFLDLHKIRTPVGNCEGFDLSLFDQMVDVSIIFLLYMKYDTHFLSPIQNNTNIC